MTILKRKRSVRFVDGYPVVRIHGKDRSVRTILQPGTDNPKTAKNSADEFLPVGCVMSPHKSSGVGNVCPHAGGCADTCLDHQGRGAAKGSMGETIHAARVARTIVYYQERDWFIAALHQELHKWEAKAARQGKRLCVRLNMFSDIAWEKHGVPEQHENVVFYDYSKNPRRIGQVAPNYWVTFSRDSSKDDDTCRELLSQGKNVAVVFDDGYTTGARNLHGAGADLPAEWMGFPIINGDATDARWTDRPGHVVGLRLKASSSSERSKALASGFAIPTGA